MHIYEVNECDWMIGESLEECKEEYIKNYCSDPDGIDDDAHELTDQELDKLKFRIRSDDHQDEITRSFKQQLAIEMADGGDFPRLFASTEE